VIGFGLYVGFFVLVGLEALRRSQSESAVSRTFSLGVLGAYTAMCLHMISDILGSVPFHILLWLYAGLIVGQRRRGAGSAIVNDGLPAATRLETPLAGSAFPAGR
jgi:hypothetical protein